MFRARAYLAVFTLTAIVVLVMSPNSAQATGAVAPKRPSSIPANYVITPFGYFHASCVTHLLEGDVIRQDENAVRHADGSSENAHVCAYPHYAANGEKVKLDVPGTEPPNISHAWVEYSGVTTSTSSYGQLTARWNVPPAPSSNDGQVVYLFPGLEDYKDVVTILQPVLGWNADFAAGWGIASWNCCVNGTVYESSPVKVAAGDVIYGKMKNTCAAGTLSCASWDVLTEDTTSGKSTTLSNTSSQGQTFNWAFAAALEVYNIATCADYPPSNYISFYDLALYNDSFVKLSNPGWSVTNSSAGLTPQCSYGGSTAAQVRLNY